MADQQPSLIPPFQPMSFLMRINHPFAFSLPPFLPMNQLDRALPGARFQAHWNPNEENNVNLIRRHSIRSNSRTRLS